MEVGQPGTPAAGARGTRWRRRWRRARSAIPSRSACRRCARHRAASTRDWYGVDLDPARVIVTSGSSAALPSGLHRALRRGRPGGARRARLSVLPPDPAGADVSPVGIRARREPLPAGARDLARAGGLAGLIVASPGQPDRHHADRPALAALIEAARRAAASAFVSDEIYHGHPLRRARRLGARDHRRGLSSSTPSRSTSP